MSNNRPVKGQHITDAERLVWEQVAFGYANKLIAHNLNVAEATVKKHLNCIMLKLGTSNRVQVALKWHGIEPGQSR